MKHKQRYADTIPVYAQKGSVKMSDNARWTMVGFALVMVAVFIVPAVIHVVVEALQAIFALAH